MEPSDGGDPYGRPARRTQWLVSALAFHYGLDRGVENEIVVLATGLDQYLQEIFHHLDWQGEGKLPGDDFRTLCRVLGLPEGQGEEEGGDLTFRQFHARLCGHFSTKAGCPAQGQGGGVARLPLGKESEHIETQIRLRSPLRRRTEKAAAAAAAAGQRKGGRSGSSSSSRSGGRRGSASPPPPPPPPGSCSRECYEEIVALEQAEDRIVKLEEENASLRELVEDMRAALQSSDARGLALQVGLWKSHANHKENGACFIHNQRLLTHSQFQNSKCLQSVLKEVELLRSSRDGQIEEAMRFNQELEKELRSSQETVVMLEDSNRNLKREQAEMRKKVEEARQAVLNSLGKVKQLEAKASEVPHLQICIQQLESELQFYRSEVLKVQIPIPGSLRQKAGPAVNGRYSSLIVQQDRSSPTGGAGAPENVEDQMFRSVEGQAASDEEEEKVTGDQPSQVAEVKKLLARLPCCSSGCDDPVVKKLMSYLGNISRDENTIVELVKRLSQLMKELETKGQEVKKLEINMEEAPAISQPEFHSPSSTEPAHVLVDHETQSRMDFGKAATDMMSGSEEMWQKLLEDYPDTQALILPEDSSAQAPAISQPEFPSTSSTEPAHGLFGEEISDSQLLSITEISLDQMKGPLLGELQQKMEEAELLKMELQMLETERVRLSLVEEKLLDVLQLLQQLRDLNISKRALGKIILNTLESCCDPQHGKPHIFEVLDTLYHELTACELIHSKSLETSPGHQSLVNPLVISC